MNKDVIAIGLFVSLVPFAQACQVTLTVGEPFTEARAKLFSEGWQPDPQAHVASGEFMGVDRNLIQDGYTEVDYCSLGRVSCVFQYTKGKVCLRLQTRGEQIRVMKVERWSSDCREQAANEGNNVLPADVRYAAQRRNECDNLGQCDGIRAFFLKLKKKYARDPSVMKALRTFDDRESQK